MATAINFTVKAINGIPSQVSRIKYRDVGGPQSRKDLYLHAGTTTRVFYWYSKRDNRQIQHRIGEFPATTIEQARKRCRELAADADKGIHPMDQKRRQRQKGITLQRAFDQYIEHAKGRAVKPIKGPTVDNYTRSMRQHFEKWLAKPADGITNDMVAKWYRSASKRSPSSANSALATAKAVINHQAEISRKQQSGLFIYNPFADHDQVTLKPRTACIESLELPAWFKAVGELSNETTRDYLTLLLFTGLRRREAAALQWENVDLRKRILTAKDTKNGTDHAIPLSGHLMDMLVRRKIDSTTPYVFPGSGKYGFIAEPKKATVSIAKRSGIDCSPHGLRRTYSNMAAFKARIPEFARKQLLNHANDKNDVTATHYSNLTMEELREYQQAVTDAILLHARQPKALAEVIKLGVAL